MKNCSLNITATGIFDVNINGHEIPDRFMPGWSNYFRHIDLCRYDITERIIPGGKNTLRITVANGWYSGKLGYGNKTNVFGDEKRLFAELTLTYDDGHTDTIVSDESWKIAGSDVIAADFFDGETIDARRRGQAGKIVGNAVITDFDVTFQVYSREPVRVTESISPQVIFSDENTVRYDFGCNFAGVIRVTAQGKRGGKIVAKYGETTDENGEVYTANLRRAKCTDEFILSGGEDTFEPKFTYHGFRYAELKKSAGTEIVSAEGLAISQDIEYYGSFECSDEVMNGVYRMALRGQKSNFISIPTACPQRDERLGWTGDAEVFCNSAMFNADCDLFFKNYLSLVREDALPDGKIPSIVPFYMGISDNTAGVPGWGDCITVIPYFHFLHYRDLSAAEDNLPAAEKWISVYDGAEKIADVFTDYISLTGVIRVYRDCSYGFHIPKYLSEKTKNASGIGNPEEERSFGYPPAEIKADGAYGWYEQKTHTEYCYGIVSGLPVDIEFLSFDEVKDGVPQDIDVIINAGDAYTSYSGGKEWLDERLQASIRRFVYNGGGFIGVGEPTACEGNGRYFQLADVLGVDEEIGYTLSVDKYNITKVPHELTAGLESVDYGEDKKNIYALGKTKVLDIAFSDRFKRNVNAGEVKMAVNEYGRGRSFYITGLPYSFENSRLLYKAMCYVAKKDLNVCYATNAATECNYYPAAKKYAVVNNSDQPQTTDFYDIHGKKTILSLAPMEIRWVNE